jgi:rhodanese-related sulfurtransferase
MAQEISPHELAAHLENGDPVELIDVRQPWENELARLPSSKLIPLNELPRRVQEISAEASRVVVVYCHHGIRSLSAAVYLTQVGVPHVRSLAGGIDAWSCEIDPAVPRY